ncbi:response regulator [Luteolibacter ambystomatis]|uniref:histidine kinase n=2 Tax=Luteolibacter ambystomatis TaxID=2824561 RepID=A0A975J1A9_9BACT|nr:response regulator [Luteolibacter ambystomatis]QUE52144.1 response regulator [Luteolibacter ambystomatis]
MLHMVPLVLSFFLWKPNMPFGLAALGTMLIVVAYFTTPDGPGRELSEIRRGFAIATLWMLAVIGHQFIRVRIASRREMWLQRGQAELGRHLVGDLSTAQLGENILGFLSSYLGAEAGAMFIEDRGSFRKSAVHAAAVESVPERFAIGEGLLGNVVKEGRLAVVQDIPEGYITIGSSLGHALPRRLLMAPFSLDGKVDAVVELGFFGPIHESDPELLQRVESQVATAVRAVKYRTKLQELLEETQRQTEELQAQSEELRVSNEEMEEQSRTLRESQSRLELQQVEMEQTNTQLEEQTRILERQKNDLLAAKVNLESQAREIEQASRYKSDFLANMSHELRTPLNSSLILAKLLAENPTGNLTAEQVKYALTIESSGKDLLSLINDVLDLSKIEAGHMEVHAEPVRIQKLMAGLRNTFAPLADQKGLELSFEADPSAGEGIETDSQRLEQVLKNLLSNAIKFTAAGSVGLHVSAADGDHVAIAVRDTGIGIAAEKQRIIFDPFFQADGTTSRKYGGTGLGLSISRHLVRLLGGEIRLQSEPGKGSLFTVVLPRVFNGPAVVEDSIPSLPSVPEPVRQPVKENGKVVPRMPDDREQLTGAGRVILAVEDDERFASILYDLAHELRFECIIATTAEEALVVAQQYVPSAIVLDVGLPDNSGLIVLERLKADSRTRHIPVHVVSAGDYTKAAMALGAVGYMLKPVRRDQLVEALRNLEIRLTQKMRRVLVVEDDPVQVEAMRDLLGSRDVEAVCARSATECLDYLSNLTFDCMVLDLSLPDASGFSLLEKLSAEDAYSFPPVIVYTGRELDPDEEQRLRRYSKSIIIKGAKSPERLLDEVTLFLHQVVSDLPPEKQRMIERAGNRDAALEGRCILVAEDDVRNVFALTSVLEAKGVKLLVARNGREAVSMLESSRVNGGASVDLVLMDIMMPEMDGLTAMREIRARREWSRLPIIALTAKAMKSDQEQCLQAGANDYLSKPLDVEKLLSLIRVWMPR